MGVVHLVDLDVQWHSVVRDDRDRCRAERAERDVLTGPAADRALLTGQRDRAAGGSDAERTCDRADDTAADARHHVTSLSTYVRVIRPPILVTIS
jgi:hypothetical protein